MINQTPGTNPNVPLSQNQKSIPSKHSKAKKAALVAIAMVGGALAGAGITAASIATITVLPIVAGALAGAAVGVVLGAVALKVSEFVKKKFFSSNLDQQHLKKPEVYGDIDSLLSAIELNPDTKIFEINSDLPRQIEKTSYMPKSDIQDERLMIEGCRYSRIRVKGKEKYFVFKNDVTDEQLNEYVKKNYN